MNLFNSSSLVLCIKLRLTLRIFPELNYTIVYIQKFFSLFHPTQNITSPSTSSNSLIQLFLPTKCFHVFSVVLLPVLQIVSYNKSNCVYHDNCKTLVLLHYVTVYSLLIFFYMFCILLRLITILGECSEIK